MQLAFDKIHCRADQMADRVAEATSAAVHDVEQAVVTSRAASLSEYEDVYVVSVIPCALCMSVVGIRCDGVRLPNTAMSCTSSDSTYKLDQFPIESSSIG